jgi:hypothetical protein
MTEERTYTLAQAAAELARQQCGARGHQPLIFSYDMTALCECGAYQWTGVCVRTVTRKEQV